MLEQVPVRDQVYRVDPLDGGDPLEELPERKIPAVGRAETVAAGADVSEKNRVFLFHHNTPLSNDIHALPTGTTAEPGHRAG